MIDNTLITGSANATKAAESHKDFQEVRGNVDGAMWSEYMEVFEDVWNLNKCST